MIQATILADSVSPDGIRLTTWELIYPRFIHAELMTHRDLSRNAASSRAIPIEKMIADVQANPAMPEHWGANQKGMQAEQQLDPETIQKCRAEWLRLRDLAIGTVRELMALGLHKQVANRALEPWFHMRTIVSTTKTQNLYVQRDHHKAQPEFWTLAKAMRLSQLESTPRLVKYDQVGEPEGWHLPLTPDLDDMKSACLQTESITHISAARCARVSYVNHLGERNFNDDFALWDRLRGSSPGHWSPLEHVAIPIHPDNKANTGNFHGWYQLRKMYSTEYHKTPRYTPEPPPAWQTSQPQLDL